MSRKSNRQLWEERIASYRSSGQSAALWCKSNQVNLNTLKSWISKLNKEAIFAKESVQWVSLQPAEMLSADPKGSLTVNIGKATIAVSSGFDSKLFTEVVQALLSLC